jgi:hypothetical protein
MFWNKSLLVTNFTEVYLTINGIYYVVDDVFRKYLLKHDINMLIETKTSIRKLRNIEIDPR